MKTKNMRKSRYLLFAVLLLSAAFCLQATETSAQQLSTLQCAQKYSELSDENYRVMVRFSVPGLSGIIHDIAISMKDELAPIRQNLSELVPLCNNIYGAKMEYIILKIDDIINEPGVPNIHYLMMPFHVENPHYQYKNERIADYKALIEKTYPEYPSFAEAVYSDMINKYYSAHGTGCRYFMLEYSNFRKLFPSPSKDIADGLESSYNDCTKSYKVLKDKYTLIKGDGAPEKFTVVFINYNYENDEFMNKMNLYMNNPVISKFDNFFPEGIDENSQNLNILYYNARTDSSEQGSHDVDCYASYAIPFVPLGPPYPHCTEILLDKILMQAGADKYVLLIKRGEYFLRYFWRFEFQDNGFMITDY